MKIRHRCRGAVILCLLAAALDAVPGAAQQAPADPLKPMEDAVTAKVSHTLVRQYTFCELRAAWWGGYDTSVTVGKRAAQDGQNHVFHLKKGVFSERTDADAKVDFAEVKGRGEVRYASKEEAFAKGLPFFISDAVMASPTELNYTVHSNPAIKIERAKFMMEFRGDMIQGSVLESPKPFNSKPEPQARTFKLHSPVDLKHKNRFEIVTELENHQGCLVSNTVDLNALQKPPQGT